MIDLTVHILYIIGSWELDKSYGPRQCVVCVGWQAANPGFHWRVIPRPPAGKRTLPNSIQDQRKNKSKWRKKIIFFLRRLGKSVKLSHHGSSLAGRRVFPLLWWRYHPIPLPCFLRFSVGEDRENGMLAFRVNPAFRPEERTDGLIMEQCSACVVSGGFPCILEWLNGDGIMAHGPYRKEE